MQVLKYKSSTNIANYKALLLLKMAIGLSYKLNVHTQGCRTVSLRVKSIPIQLDIHQTFSEIDMIGTTASFRNDSH